MPALSGLTFSDFQELRGCLYEQTVHVGETIVKQNEHIPAIFIITDGIAVLRYVEDHSLSEKNNPRGDRVLCNYNVVRIASRIGST